MRFSRIASLLLFVLLCAHAESQTPEGSGPFRIAGRIVNSATGAPVPKATVSILSEDNSRIVASTQSSDDGSFTFDRVPAGKYPLTASKRGFRIGFYEQHEEFSTAIVAGEGQDTGHLLFHLNPNAVIAGTITADGGDPVERASVMLFRNPSSSGETVEQVQQTFTDDTGAYEFANLTPGEYFVAVQAHPWYAVYTPENQNASTEHSPLDVAYPITFFDSATQESAATPISIEAGEHAQADISLHAVPALHIKLNQLQKTSAAGINIQLNIFGKPVPITTFDPGGGPATSEVATGLAPGRYVLNYGYPQRTAEINATSDTEISPDSGTPTSTVTGHVRFLDGGASSAPVIVLMPAAESRSGSAIPAPIQQSNFRIESVPPGTWTVRLAEIGADVHPPQVVSIESAGVTAAGDQITITDQPLNIVVTATQSASTIRGFALKAGKPAVAAMIVLVPHDPHAWPSLVRRDQSDSDGSFALQDVVPGRYTVIAIEDGWKLNWHNYQDLARFLPGGVNVNVTEHSGAVLSLPQAVQAQAR